MRDNATVMLPCLPTQRCLVVKMYRGQPTSYTIAGADTVRTRMVEDSISKKTNHCLKSMPTASPQRVRRAPESHVVVGHTP